MVPVGRILLLQFIYENGPVFKSLILFYFDDSMMSSNRIKFDNRRHFRSTLPVEFPTFLSKFISDG